MQVVIKIEKHLKFYNINDFTVYINLFMNIFVIKLKSRFGYAGEIKLDYIILKHNTILFAVERVKKICKD